MKINKNKNKNRFVQTTHTHTHTHTHSHSYTHTRAHTHTHRGAFSLLLRGDDGLLGVVGVKAKWKTGTHNPPV